METGKNGNYSWLTCDFAAGKLLELCPEIVLGRYVAVTAFDSGPLKPTEDEKKQGWREDGLITWSPKILSTEVLPHHEYDEWYIFPSPSLFKPQTIFVNLANFGLRDPAYLMDNLEPTWDRVGLAADIERIRGIQECFWAQLSSIQPESYLAEGDRLVFVTRNSEHFAHTVASLKH